MPSGSYVFASNHLSYMDTPVVLSHIPCSSGFWQSVGLFKIPLLGTHLGQAGHIPVPREDPRASIKTMQTAAEVMQNRKISLLIFPEGGRSHDGRLQPFKEGAAYIAIRAGAPLVPVASSACESAAVWLRHSETGQCGAESDETAADERPHIEAAPRAYERGAVAHRERTRRTCRRQPTHLNCERRIPSALNASPLALRVG